MREVTTSAMLIAPDLFLWSSEFSACGARDSVTRHRSFGLQKGRWARNRNSKRHMSQTLHQAMEFNGLTCKGAVPWQ